MFFLHSFKRQSNHQNQLQILKDVVTITQEISCNCVKGSNEKIRPHECSYRQFQQRKKKSKNQMEILEIKHSNREKNQQMTQSTKESVYLKTSQQELHKLRCKEKKKQCKSSNSSGIIVKGIYISLKEKRRQKTYLKNMNFPKFVIDSKPQILSKEYQVV